MNLRLGLSKRSKIISIVIISIVLFALIITMMNKLYFSQHVFYLNDHKFKISHEQTNSIVYRNGTLPNIEVTNVSNQATITIDNQRYLITKNNKNKQYEVIYPSGHRYEVIDQSGLLLSYDENGEWVVQMSAYSNGQRLMSEGEEFYHPSSLVSAAYVEYHTTQGNLIVFIISLLLCVYGWCSFRYEKFQNFLFLLSFHWIWVNDAEPSDFYYFMCKVGGIVMMILSGLLFLKSF
ncbi:MAG: hypothetical protein P0Y55_06985 [Candidatus Cohnella colombiensis]|uniref:DUF6199 domain-containing protein n=1 Tax=Candidatus Cohnella colombiensis TaxID=3121368 RepID=A0AA95EYE6_9BACL|nr:MAG: hypothetical protein P0Y55_06985 [Cohnella sp.]